MLWNPVKWFDMFKTTPPEITETRTTEIKNNLHVVWLHGANQTSNSFNYLRNCLPNWDCTLINYNSQNGFYENLTEMVNELDCKKPTFIIGHSMGGLYALHLTQHINVVGAVSISTPYRGSSMADWAKYIVPNYKLFRDVGRRSLPIQEGHEIEIDIPWTQIISTTGSVPYYNEPNDGVCTIASMEYRKDDMKIIYVPHTHYEVVCSSQVAEIIHFDYIELYKKFNP